MVVQSFCFSSDTQGEFHQFSDTTNNLMNK